MFQQAQAELSSTPPEVFSDCAAASRKFLLEAYAFANLGQDRATRESIRQAEGTCLKPDPALAADIAAMRGTVLDELQVAGVDHLASLMLARQQHDTFRETKALINLCNTAQQLEHYDESIDWGMAALQISKTMSYLRYEEKAEGNLAWNYYKLGNFNRALELFRDAKETARELGAAPDELRWENNLGLVREQQGEVLLAKVDYEQALKMGRAAER